MLLSVDFTIFIGKAPTKIMLLSNIFPVLLLICFVKECSPEETSSFFTFRKTTLNNFNEARRLLASGDIRKLYNIVAKLIPVDLFNADVLGPASNMYKLKWSRSLEQIGFEYMTDKGVKRSSNPKQSIEYKDHIGFYWLGNVFNILNDIIPTLKIGDLKKALEKFLAILEVLIIFIWMAATAPKTLPLKDGALHGPAEALFGERYEIGCFTEIAYSVCFMKRLPYKEHMFKVGIPCTSCPTHCEFTKQADGTYEEGELCVAPVEEQINFVAGNMTVTGGAAPCSVPFTILVQSILILVYCLFHKH